MAATTSAASDAAGRARRHAASMASKAMVRSRASDSPRGNNCRHPAAPVKERRANPLFQMLYLMADRGLCDEQAVGRSPETAGPGHSLKKARRAFSGGWVMPQNHKKT